MYTTCLFCSGSLGTNRVIRSFPVGERLAFDPLRGRLWVVCRHCGRWNLSALEERWEALEECEDRFRRTRLRFSTENIGLARLDEGLELIRIGRALRPEIAAWRYGRLLVGRARRARAALAQPLAAAVELGARAIGVAGRALPRSIEGHDLRTWLRIRLQPDRVIDSVAAPGGDRVLVRYRHLPSAELIRPESGAPWRLVVPHESGLLTMTGPLGLRSAGKLLAALNGLGAPRRLVQGALRKLDEAGNPDGYFARVALLALRTSWGRFPEAPPTAAALFEAGSDSERLALYLTSRSFWAHGAIGSEPSTTLTRIPLVDRLALEMAANEDAERRALQGELAELERAWREAEEIAAIADDLRVAAERLAGALRGWRRLRPAEPAFTPSLRSSG